MSVLFLDISQAFPSVSHSRLIHNLRKRNIPEEVINWTKSFLSNRKTKLHFDDHVTDPLLASSGIPQGSPLSPILYLFYSADLLEITEAKRKDLFTAGYIDDTMLAAVSDSIQDNITKLEELSRRALQWSRTHACKFDLGKFQLIHFTRNERKYSPLSLRIDGHTVNPSTAAKYLGIMLDQKLRWHEHAEMAISKGTKTMLAIARLTQPTFGLPHKYMHQLYQSVVIPKVEYGLLAWYVPIQKAPTAKRSSGSVGVARRIGKVQRLAAKIIMGGFRTTSTDALDFHAVLPPTSIHLNHAAFNATARLSSLPPSHPLFSSVRRCANRYPRFH